MIVLTRLLISSVEEELRLHIVKITKKQALYSVS
jgi:hypothetical protein